eukprot:CAMPEP_0170173358 /NCGR_PEP_ID=MMETSP0040_2-20121228/6635_1 /TAXON_ID=641309 /ORGANISM="Lotharella oceanica, Strain CCMP622" /LENGTH=216 /DNA_ID=CAMNT_0010414497 /DNA_START=411 /DNA_END=1057 /DNA_ORIENTATION=+
MHNTNDESSGAHYGNGHQARTERNRRPNPWERHGVPGFCPRGIPHAWNRQGTKDPSHDNPLAVADTAAALKEEKADGAELAGKEDGVVEYKVIENQADNDGENSRRFLHEVAMWLLINAVEQEHVMHASLCVQNLHNVWRRTAFDRILNHWLRNGKHTGSREQKEATELCCIDILTDVPSVLPEKKFFLDTLKTLVAEKLRFIDKRAVKDGVKSVA